jgi:hypothetical protein
MLKALFSMEIGKTSNNLLQRIFLWQDTSMKKRARLPM